MKKSYLSFVGIILLLLIACSKKKDTAPEVDPPANNNPNNPNPNDSTPKPPPVFTDFFPATAFIGDTITLIGQNLDTNLNVLAVGFGGVESTIVSASKTAVKAIVPDNIERSKVTIQLIVKDTVLSSAKDFNLKTPVIESISHTSGFPGQTIKITGRGFRNSYKFDQVSLGDKLISKGSTTPGTGTLTIRVPSNTPAGKYPVSVTVAGLTAYSPDPFTVIVQSIHSMTPVTGPVGTEVTIKGENFIDANGGNTVVILNGVQTGSTFAAPMTSRTNNEIKFLIPLMTAGEYKVSVNVLGSYVSAADRFIYIEP